MSNCLAFEKCVEDRCNSELNADARHECIQQGEKIGEMTLKFRMKDVKKGKYALQSPCVCVPSKEEADGHFLDGLVEFYEFLKGTAKR